MLMVSYDFADDKTRTKFAKFLKQYGERVQYSVYEVRNSPRVLKNILVEVELKYKKKFKKTDSVMIFHMCEGCTRKVQQYGYAEHRAEDVVYFS